MKFLLLLIGLVLVIAKAKAETEFFKLDKASQDCEEELGEPKGLLEKMRTGQKIGDPKKAGAIALCINKTMGHMKKNGELIPDAFKIHVDGLTEDPDTRKKVIAKCGVKNGKTPEEAALNFVKCMQSFKLRS